MSANGRVIPTPRPSLQARAARTSTIVVANSLKVLGGVIATNEFLIRDQVRPLAVGMAALLIAGVNAIEGFLLQIIDRILGR